MTYLFWLTDNHGAWWIGEHDEVLQTPTFVRAIDRGHAYESIRMEKAGREWKRLNANLPGGVTLSQGAALVGGYH